MASLDMPTRQTDAALPPTSSQTLLLSLPDELIEHIVGFLPHPDYDAQTVDEFASLVLVNKRIRNVVLPLQWETIEISSKSPLFASFSDALRLRGSFNKTLSAHVILGASTLSDDLDRAIRTVTRWLAHCGSLRAFSFRMCDTGSPRSPPTWATSAAALFDRLRVHGKQLVQLELHLLEVLLPPQLAQMINALMPRMPMIRRLAVHVSAPWQNSVQPLPPTLDLLAIPNLDALDISDVRLCRGSSGCVPAVHKVFARTYDGPSHFNLASCLGDTITHLLIDGCSIGNFGSPVTQVLLPCLSRITYRTSDISCYFLTTHFDPATPLQHITLYSIAQSALDVLRFVASQKTISIRRVLVEFPDKDYLDVKLLRDQPRWFPKRYPGGWDACSAFDTMKHVRLKQFRDELAVYGVRVIAPWFDEQVGGQTVHDPQGHLKGYHL